MNGIFRTFSLLVLVAVPVLAIARPPLIYHHLVAHPGDTVRAVLSQQDVVIYVSPSNSATVSTAIQPGQNVALRYEVYLRRGIRQVGTAEPIITA